MTRPLADYYDRVDHEHRAGGLDPTERRLVHHFIDHVGPERVAAYGNIVPASTGHGDSDWTP
jgi:hypothetical protein